MDTGRNKQLKPGRQQSPGRITVDSRGRNVWQWDQDQLDSTTIMLQSLDNSALALEPTRSLRRPGADEGEAGGAKAPSGQASGSPSRKTFRDRSSAAARDGDADDSAAIRLEQTFSVKLGGGGFDPYNRS